MARLTRHDWLEAEELYKQGWTQKQIGEKFKVRPETVSQHMTKLKVKGGEKVDVVRQEMEAALMRKVKEFAEKRANRTIDTKEKFHTLINSLLAFFVREMKEAQDKGTSLDKISGSARALKEAVSGLKMAREELYAILEIKPEISQDEVPDLFVMTMNDADEARIRGSGAYQQEDDDDEANMMAELAELEAAVNTDPSGKTDE